MWQWREAAIQHAKKSANKPCNPILIVELLGWCKGGVCSVAVKLLRLHHMLHLLKQQSRQPHRSQDPWCCPRWRVNGSSGPRSPTPGRCRWIGWLQMFGSGLVARRSGCCPVLLADRGCWWWSPPRCSPEGCWPQWGHCWEPMLWDSYRRWWLSGWRSIPAPAPAQQFSIDNVTHRGCSQPRKAPK